MSSFIPLSVPTIKGNEWKYIKECLDTGWVSSAGKYVDLFEQKIAEYTGAKYAIACMNGTSALHISLILAGVQPGDEVIVPTLTFIAPIYAVKYISAFPVFMDADEFYNIDAIKTIDFIKNKTELQKCNSKRYENQYLTINKYTNRYITAIIPVHVFGNAVQLDELFDLCKERNIKIIEDSTEALGTRYIEGKFKGKHTGTVGDIGTLSFNGNKIITTGGGGMILTDSLEFAERGKYLTTQAKDDSINYIHDSVGFNYRMNNLQAAMGVAQLEKLPFFLSKKRKNYEIYKERIHKIVGLKIAETPKYAENNHWMYALQIEPNNYNMSKDEILIALKKNRIESRPVWKLNHLQKPFMNSQSHDISNATKLHDYTLNIPCSTSLSEEDIIDIVKRLEN